MLQKSKPMKTTYYNGVTYAIAPPTGNILLICETPNGPIISTKTFCKLNKGYTIEDYIKENGYKKI